MRTVFRKGCAASSKAIDSARDNQFLQFQALLTSCSFATSWIKVSGAHGSAHLLDALFLYQQWAG